MFLEGGDIGAVLGEGGLCQSYLKAVLRTSVGVISKFVKPLKEGLSITLCSIVEVPHKTRGSYFTVGSPIKFSDLKPEITGSPLLGEHTDQILAELGYSKDQIKAMHDAKAV